MNIKQALRKMHNDGSTIVTRFAYRQLVTENATPLIESGEVVRLKTNGPPPDFCLSAGLATPKDAECAATVAVCCAARTSGARSVGALPDAAIGPIPAPHGATLPQVEAWRMITQEHTCIVTGKPGSGKSWLIEKLYPAYSTRGLTVKVVALTGVASVMLASRLGRRVSTIHSEFQFEPSPSLGDGKMIDCDVLIVDEAPMIDTRLMAAMLLNIPNTTKLILLGDDKQILSVSRGWPVVDLIRQKVFPSVHLDIVKRMGGSLASFVDLIREGLKPRLENFDAVTHHWLKDKVLVEAAVAWYTKYADDDAVILTPFRDKKAVNVEAINRELFELSFGELVAPDRKLGDKLMATRNSREMGVFNGEVFRLLRHGQHLVLKNKRTVVRVSAEQLKWFKHAWAMSVHKAQGSEFDQVMIVLPHAARSFVTRNILYTGMTRAKQELLIIGSPYTLEQSIDRPPIRHTALSILLNNLPLARELRFEPVSVPPVYTKTTLTKVF